jgi:hypothetical protein
MDRSRAWGLDRAGRFIAPIPKVFPIPKGGADECRARLPSSRELNETSCAAAKLHVPELVDRTSEKRVVDNRRHLQLVESNRTFVVAEKCDIRGIAPGGHARQSLPLRRQRDEITLQPDHLRRRPNGNLTSPNLRESSRERPLRGRTLQHDGMTRLPRGEPIEPPLQAFRLPRPCLPCRSAVGQPCAITFGTIVC